MSAIRRVVFDTSTLVSAALRIGSIPYQALSRAISSCELSASEETLAELERVLCRSKFDAYLDPESRRAFVAFIRRNARIYAVQVIHPSGLNPPCRDPQDNKFLTLVLAAEADALVSSDEDLLVLHPWQDIPIMKPAEFLANVV